AEIISNPDVGVTVPIETYFDLFSERAASQLADGVLEGIELARKPNTSGNCRQWAEPWGLENVGARLEGMLEEMASSQSGRTAVASRPGVTV
ncbi:MAG: hypothetical protein ACE5FA_11580, partial [Dehalococcoidia bacterium]